MIPLMDITPDPETKARIIEGIARVANKNAFILGEEVEAFEEEWAAFCQARHCVAVSSGTAALRLAMKAVLPPDCHIVVPAFTFTATAFAASLEGFRVHFSDVTEEGLIDPQLARNEFHPDLAAIVPVHLYGQMATNHPHAYHQRLIIEDACQAHGHPFHESTACFSFYPSKNLGAFGDAGAVVTNDSLIALEIKALRDYGRYPDRHLLWIDEATGDIWPGNSLPHHGRYMHSQIAGNERMDAIQAAVLRAKLPDLREQIRQRRLKAAHYDTLFREAGLPFRGVGDIVSVWHLYVVRVPEGRDELLKFLNDRGIMAAVHYPIPVPKQPAYNRPESYPVAERLAREVISLPFWPGMSESIQEQVVEAVKEWRAMRQKIASSDKIAESAAAS